MGGLCTPITAIGVLLAGALLVGALLLPDEAVGRSGGQSRAASPLGIVTVATVTPYRPGDLVWTTPPPPADTASLDLMATGCDRVPASGYLGTNVYADSNAHYANYWYWSDSSSSQPFWWYLKKGDNSNQGSGYSTGAGDAISVPGNIYRWKVQNKGSSPQAWTVCYDVF